MEKKRALKQIAMLEENMKEIDLIADMYESILLTPAKSEQEASAKSTEAKFARERMLKLSLHSRHLLSELEVQDYPK
jgi:hypothetical protein